MPNNLPPISRRAVLLAGALALPAIAAARSRLTLVVAAAPQSLGHLLAEELALHLARLRGAAVGVVAEPLANGRAAAQRVAAAAADGATLLLAPASLLAGARWLYGAAMPLDPLRAFAPVSRLCSLGYAFVVAADRPWHSLQAVVAAAQDRPGQLVLACKNAGSLQWLTVMEMMRVTGIRVQHRPHATARHAITALARGEVDMALSPPVFLREGLRSGALRAVAVSTALGMNWVPELQGVPGMAAALPGSRMDAMSWIGVVAPAATPGPVLDELHGQIGHAMVVPELQRRLLDRGVLAATDVSHRAFASFLRQETERWRRLVAEAGLMGALAG